jgi:flagellar assembly protein FliH
MGVIRREQAPAVAAFSFDDLEARARRILADAKAAAAQMLSRAQAAAARAEQEAQTRIAAAHAAALEEARRAGRAAALTQVRAEASEEARRAARAELDRLTAALSAALAEYDRSKRALLAPAESGLVELALAIARRVCKLELEPPGVVAAANARALLELVRHDHDLELHVHPADHELLAANVREFAARTLDLQHVRIEPDDSVARGGCVLRTSAGRITARIEEQLERLAAALCGRPADSAAPTPGAP